MRPFQSLVKHFEPDQPVYGILSQALLGEPIALTTVEELAAYYIKAIQALRPNGPYNFLGFSFGGLVAFEMARQLHDRGEVVGVLALLDNRWMGAPGKTEGSPRRVQISIARHLKVLLGPRGIWHMKEKLVTRGLREIYSLLRALRRPIPRFLQRTDHINWFAAASYVPQFYPGSVTLFPASDSVKNPDATNGLWASLAGGGAELHSIPGGHEDVLQEPNVSMLAKILTGCLADANHDGASIIILI